MSFEKSPQKNLFKDFRRDSRCWNNEIVQVLFEMSGETDGFNSYKKVYLENVKFVAEHIIYE